MKKSLLSFILVAFLFSFVALYIFIDSKKPDKAPQKPISEVKIISGLTKKEESIKWMDFTPDYKMLKKAVDYDIDSQGKFKCYELLAYAVAKNWGNSSKVCLGYIDEAVKLLEDGQNIEIITKDLKYYDFYRQAYSAVLSGFLGIRDDNSYGFKVFSPVAKNFYFSHYNDFGAQRTYGFSRTHKGNDLLLSVGTPIINVEGGYIEEIGWNQYGGWRIGIRSYDKKRYYYYAHLRKNHPFQEGLYKGKEVKAGEVIGYGGMTGYSTKENVNNIETPHLHFGMEIIFDEERRKKGDEIWIDVYSIIELLDSSKSEVVYSDEKKEYFSPA